MNIPCEVIMDLLPLYHDNICNKASKIFVERHLEECAMCRERLEKMRDTTIDRQLQLECSDVVGRHAKMVKRRTLFWGISIPAFVFTLMPFFVFIGSGEWEGYFLLPMITVAMIWFVSGVVLKLKGKI